MCRKSTRKMVIKLTTAHLEEIMLYAAFMGDVDAIERCFKKSHSGFSFKDRKNRSIIHHAVLGKRNEIIRTLIKIDEIEFRKHINDKDNFQNAPIHYAAKDVNSNGLELLLKSGADGNLQGHFKQTALHLLAKADDYHYFTLMISPNAVEPPQVCRAISMPTTGGIYEDSHVGYKSNSWSNRPLLLEEPSDVLEPFIAKSTLIGIGKNEGKTQFKFKVKSDNLKCVKMLMNSRASPHLRDKWNQTPLHLAAQNGKHEILNALMFEEQDTNGRTPLHLAVIAKSLPCITLLLES